MILPIWDRLVYTCLFPSTAAFPRRPLNRKEPAQVTHPAHTRKADMRGLSHEPVFWLKISVKAQVYAEVIWENHQGCSDRLVGQGRQRHNAKGGGVAWTSRGRPPSR